MGLAGRKNNRNFIARWQQAVAGQKVTVKKTCILTNFGWAKTIIKLYGQVSIDPEIMSGASICGNKSANSKPF